MRRELGCVLVVAMTVIVGIGCSSNTERSPRDGLPFYYSAEFTPRWSNTVEHRISEFSLVTQTGDTITRDDLLGRLHVASFIFTSCNVICPTLVTQLLKVQDVVAHRDDVLLVSYSVAPRYDSVAVCLMNLVRTVASILIVGSW